MLANIVNTAVILAGRDGRTTIVYRDLTRVSWVYLDLCCITRPCRSFVMHTPWPQGVCSAAVVPFLPCNPGLERKIFNFGSKFQIKVLAVLQCRVQLSEQGLAYCAAMSSRCCRSRRCSRNSLHTKP